jgi:solute carrier family 39 (zinc transporter), member 1/2/3
MCCFFARRAVSAIGIIAGWLISASDSGGNGKNAATVTLQGMAAGTIVFVTFFEILQREKSSNQNGFLQLSAIIIGFAAMVGLMAIGKYIFLILLMHL